VIAISLRGLTKRFGAKVAVAGIDLDVPVGSFFGLVGPNGAGKTTTLRMATGLLRPDGGSVTILDTDVWSAPSEAKAKIGVLPEDVPLFDRLTAWELLSYTGLLRSMPESTITERSHELLDVFGLTADAGSMVVDFSQGMRKKMGLACALLHAPRVLFLDEPFESVDPVSSRTIREVLRSFTASGGTIVFSSHVMETVQNLCDRVAIVHQGRIVASGAVDEVRGQGSLEDAFFSLVGVRPDASGRLAWLSSSSG
jgi:ABC-2 type transport system ATP-binding protein